MCGINGILHLQPQKKVDERISTKMRDTLEHRGPDDKGLFIENNLGLGIDGFLFSDVSEAWTPTVSLENGRYVMVYNGEIYNFKDFYPETKNQRVCHKNSFRHGSLVETVRIARHQTLHRLNGMFAFVIWDKERTKTDGSSRPNGRQTLVLFLLQRNVLLRIRTKSPFRGWSSAKNGARRTARIHFQPLCGRGKHPV